jgi:hypothetical protein
MAPNANLGTAPPSGSRPSLVQVSYRDPSLVLYNTMNVQGTYTSRSRAEQGGGRRLCQAGARRDRKSMAQLAIDHGVALVWPTSVMDVIALKSALLGTFEYE